MNTITTENITRELAARLLAQGYSIEEVKDFLKLLGAMGRNLREQGLI